MADETKTIIIDVEVPEKDFEKEIGKVNAAIRENKEEIKELSKDYENNATAISKLEAENRDLSKSKQQLIKESKTEANSLNALRLKVANLTKERNNLDTSTKEGAKRFKELNKEILANTNQIKEAEEAGGDFRRSVGNYTEAIEEAALNTPIFGFTLEGIGAQLTKLINPLTAAIGLIGAIGAAYISTGRGSRDLARATDRLGTAMNDFSNSIADLLTSDDGVGVLDGFLQALQISVLGLASTIRSNLIVAIKEEIREFEIAQRESDRLGKTLLDQIEFNRQIRDEERNSIKVRSEANERALAIINSREEALIKTQEQQLSNLQLLLLLDAENLELQLAIRNVEFEIADIREESQGFRSEILANDLALAREISAQRVELVKAQVQEEILNAEKGSERELELKKKLVTESSKIEIEAAGKNELLKQTIIQNSNNAILQLQLEFDERLAAAREQAAAARAKQNQKEFNDEIKRIQGLAAAASEAHEQEVNDELSLLKLKDDVNKQIVTGTLNLLAELSGSGKIAALTQAGINIAQGITKALAQGGIAGIATGALVAAAGVVQLNKIKNAPTIGGGGGGTASVSIPSAGGVSQVSGLANVNGATLLSQFSTPVQNQADQNAAIIEGISNMPQATVAVVEINTAQDNRAVKVGEAELG